MSEKEEIVEVWVNGSGSRVVKKEREAEWAMANWVGFVGENEIEGIEDLRFCSCWWVLKEDQYFDSGDFV